MWEFSIIVKKDDTDLIDYIYSSLENLSKDYGCILTKYIEEQDINLIIACEEIDKPRISFYINDCITEIICTIYKEKFLNERLQNIFSDEINMIALKNALIAFDKETDRYIVTKYLEINKNLNIDSFFNFRLKYLKEKWGELARIANDNSNCLVSNETLIELLKFLVDNLDINNEVVNVVEENGFYSFYDMNFDLIEIKDKKNISKEGFLISNLISLCPKRIVLYYENQNTSACSLIKQIFFKKITFLPVESLLRKNLIN